MINSLSENAKLIIKIVIETFYDKEYIKSVESNIITDFDDEEVIKIYIKVTDNWDEECRYKMMSLPRRLRSALSYIDENHFPMIDYIK